MNEANTRAELIDRQLRKAGWDTSVNQSVMIYREYRIQGEPVSKNKQKSSRKADYVLYYNSKMLAVIEAKRATLNVTEGVAQAKLYAEKLRLNMCYAANGKSIYQINRSTGEEHEVNMFPSPDELWSISGDRSNVWDRRFGEIPFSRDSKNFKPRYYQEIAVKKILEKIATGDKRILLTLATGTGKTHIAFQIAWILFKSRWTIEGDMKRRPRILFLADRNILVDQAYVSFSKFEEQALTRINPSNKSKHESIPKNGNVFFATYQSLMSGKEGAEQYMQYDFNFFDFIIIDECHRGGTSDESTWRLVLEYFSNAVQLGLTATPKRDANVDTYHYFGEPVFSYSLKEGVEDNYLVPYRVSSVTSNIDDYKYEKDDQVIEGTIDEEKTYRESEFNRKIEIREREEKRVKDMLSSIAPNQKVIIFCVDQTHAGIIRDITNQISDSQDPNYCVRITSNDGDIGNIHLENFKDNEKLIPTIVTTSHKLSTGVDILNIRYIVLMRKISNTVEFKQIIGRGTRLFEGKEYFTVIDFSGAVDDFRDSNWDGDIENADNALGETPSGKPQRHNGRNSGGENGGSGKEKQMLRVTLSNGRRLKLKSSTSSLFYVDGEVISLEEFLNRLYDTTALPDIFKDEAELRKIWSNPCTRNELLNRLSDVGINVDDLEMLKEHIELEKCDLIDVLEFIAYAQCPTTRVDRVESSRSNIYRFITGEQREFVDYVLENYISSGNRELDISNLDNIIRARYGSIDAACKALGPPEEIRKTFVDFQKHLYLKAS